MICKVVVNDFEIGEKMVIVLDDADFAIQQAAWNDTDNLLQFLQNNYLFAGRLKWSDLEVVHFHMMIVNMLKILAGANHNTRVDRTSAAMLRLAFFLCSLIFLLQKPHNTQIELLKITRLATDDVSYDIASSLDIKIEPTKNQGGLKMIANDED